MSGRPGYGLPPNPNAARNPFANQAPFSQPRRDYDSESDAGSYYERRDTYGSVNSTTNLHSGQPLNSPYGSYSTYTLLVQCPIGVVVMVADYMLGDNDSDIDVYGNQYEGSVDSHLGGSTYSSYQQDIPGPRGSKEPYPAWTADCQVPISSE